MVQNSLTFTSLFSRNYLTIDFSVFPRKYARTRHFSPRQMVRATDGMAETAGEGTRRRCYQDFCGGWFSPSYLRARGRLLGAGCATGAGVGRERVCDDRVKERSEKCCGGETEGL